MLGDPEAVYKDVTAPCNPKPATLAEIEEILLKQVPREPAYLLAALGSLPIARALKYLQTLQHSPAALAHQIATGPTLFREAGAAATRGNPNVPTHLRFHIGDLASRRTVWQHDILAHWQHTRFEEKPGGHLTIVHPSNLVNRIRRIKELSHQRGYDGDYSDVDFEAVLQAHIRRRSATLQYWPNKQAA